MKFVPVKHGTYCQLKNHGAARSRGDVLIFLDSDVIPEENWLQVMITAFRDPSIDAVIGNSYTDYSDGRIYSKTLALTWMFPRPSGVKSVLPATDFYANNFAIRRHKFLDQPFQDTPGFIHGAARQFVSDLKRNGVRLWHIADAQAAHPPPSGIRHFGARALATGRAMALNPDPTTARSSMATILSGLRLLPYHCKIILLDRQTVELSLWHTPIAMIISSAYELLIVTGFVISRLFPKTMVNRLDL